MLPFPKPSKRDVPGHKKHKQSKVFNKILEMTPEKVLEALSNVQEPDLGKDIVTLNMVQNLEINGNYVAFTVVLTTPACPMKDHIKNACINAIKLLVNKDATVNVKFTANTTTQRKDAREVLP